MSEDNTTAEAASVNSLDLSIEEVSCPEGLCALAADWRRLEIHAATPFSSYDWAVCWWEHLREDKFSVSDSLAVKVLRWKHEVVAIAPMMLTRRPSRGPFCVRQMHFLGADPNMTEQRGLVAHPAFSVAAYRKLAEHLAETADQWDWAVVSGVPARAGIVSRSLTDLLDMEVVAEIPEYQLRLPPSWEQLKAGLPRNVKESLRKCYNSPKRAGLDLTFEVRSEPVEAEMAEFFRLHRARALLENAVAHGDVFSSESSRQFLLEVCRRFAVRNCFRLFLVKYGDQVVSARVGFVVADTLYLYFSGFEPEFGRHSVATLLVAEAIQYAIQEGLATVHLSMGADRSKLRWRPEERIHREIQFTSPHVRARLARGLYEYSARLASSAPLAGLTHRYLTRRAQVASH